MHQSFFHFGGFLQNVSAPAVLRQPVHDVLRGLEPDEPIFAGQQGRLQSRRVCLSVRF